VTTATPVVRDVLLVTSPEPLRGRLRLHRPAGQLRLHRRGVVLGEVDASQPFWVVTYPAHDGLATELKVVETAWI
jgi:hypothetical protein